MNEQIDVNEVIKNLGNRIAQDAVDGAMKDAAIVSLRNEVARLQAELDQLRSAE